MISSSLLKSLLFISNPKVLGLSNYLNEAALYFILPAFYIGLISEYFTNFDFKSVAKRAAIAFLVIKLMTPIHVVAVEASLQVSSELVRKYSPQNKFLTAYQNARGASVNGEENGVWGKLTSIVKVVVSDPIVMIIFLLSYIAFFLLTQLYSLTYHLTIAMIGLCAVLSILPITSRSLTGAVKTSLWCMIMPFVVAIVLCLVGDSDAFFKTYTGGIVQNLESLIQLLIMTIILLLTPMITTKIMNDSGVSGMAENLGQMAGMATLIGGSSIASRFIGGKSMALGGAIHNSTSKPLINGLKGVVSKKASAISESKGVGPTMQTLISSSPSEKFKSGLSDFKDNMKKTTLAEKMVLGADGLINRSENSLASIGRQKEASAFSNYQNNSVAKKGTSNTPNGKINTPDIQKSVVPLSSYKQEAREFLGRKDKALQNYKRTPESSHFLKTRTPHVLNPKPIARGGTEILNRSKIEPKKEIGKLNTATGRESFRRNAFTQNSNPRIFRSRPLTKLEA
jgi:hypothetical protein